MSLQYSVIGLICFDKIADSQILGWSGHHPDTMATRQLASSASVLARRSLLGAWRTPKQLGIIARLYSASKLHELDASQLSITRTSTPKELKPPEELVFGHNFTDHMLSCEWTASQGRK